MQGDQRHFKIFEENTVTKFTGLEIVLLIIDLNFEGIWM